MITDCTNYRNDIKCDFMFFLNILMVGTVHIRVAILFRYLSTCKWYWAPAKILKMIQLTFSLLTDMWRYFQMKCTGKRVKFTWKCWFCNGDAKYTHPTCPLCIQTLGGSIVLLSAGLYFMKRNHSFQKTKWSFNLWENHIS